MKECLGSLLNQDYVKEFEIIIVDNFSNDGTSGFIKDKFGERAKLITNQAKLKLKKAKNILPLFPPFLSLAAMNIFIL